MFLFQSWRGNPAGAHFSTCKQDVSLLDVRPYEQYLEGHIPHAVHIKAHDVCDSGLPSTDPGNYLPCLESKGVDGLKPLVVCQWGFIAESSLLRGSLQFAVTTHTHTRTHARTHARMRLCTKSCLVFRCMMQGTNGKQRFSGGRSGSLHIPMCAFYVVAWQPGAQKTATWSCMSPVQ